MESARPLRDVFNELVGEERADRDAVLRDSGHGDLPGGLVAEAVVSYADTAPVEVAEHLAPFVMAHSAVPVDGLMEADAEPAAVLDLLATAPAGADPAAELDGGALDGLESAQTGPDPTYAGAGGDAADLDSADTGPDPTYGGDAAGLESADPGADLAYAGPDPFDLAFGAGGGPEAAARAGEAAPAGEAAGAGDPARPGDTAPEPDQREDAGPPEPDEPQWSVDVPELPVGVAPEFSDDDTDPSDEEEPIGDGG